MCSKWVFQRHLIHLNKKIFRYFLPFSIILLPFHQSIRAFLLFCKHPNALTLASARSSRWIMHVDDWRGGNRVIGTISNYWLSFCLISSPFETAYKSQRDPKTCKNILWINTFCINFCRVNWDKYFSPRRFFNFFFFWSVCLSKNDDLHHHLPALASKRSRRRRKPPKR